MRSGALRTFGVVGALGLAAIAACSDDTAARPPPAGDTTTTTEDADGATTTTTTTALPAGPPTIVTTTPPGADLGPLRLTESSTVSTLGLGVVTFGMTIDAAERAAGTRLLPDPGAVAGPDCIVLTPEEGPPGIRFTVTARTVERVDIEPPSTNGTLSGARIGMAVDELEALFDDRLQPTPSPEGTTYVFVPRDPNDAAFRVIFETDGEVVTSLRAGRVAAVAPRVPCT